MSALKQCYVASHKFTSLHEPLWDRWKSLFTSRYMLAFVEKKIFSHSFPIKLEPFHEANKWGANVCGKHAMNVRKNREKMLIWKRRSLKVSFYLPAADDDGENWIFLDHKSRNWMNWRGIFDISHALNFFLLN